MKNSVRYLLENKRKRFTAAKQRTKLVQPTDEGMKQCRCCYTFLFQFVLKICILTEQNDSKIMLNEGVI